MPRAPMGWRADRGGGGVDKGTDRSAASNRAVEIGVAAVILLFGLVVAGDSFRLGARWGEDGPQPGYFPFYIGLLICISSVTILVRGWRNSALADESFVSREELKKILTVLVPTVVYVSLIAYLGFYVTSTLYIAYFMWHLGKYGWVKIVPVAVGVSVAFFLIFEKWFQVPLPKGPLEAAFGLS
jgi:putative tricarboxylic transport membrane protein